MNLESIKSNDFIKKDKPKPELPTVTKIDYNERGKVIGLEITISHKEISLTGKQYAEWYLQTFHPPKAK